MVPYPPVPVVPDNLDETLLVEVIKMYYAHCLDIDKLNTKTYDLWSTQLSISK